MANNILTPDMITREALRVLENSLVITRNVNRQYDSSYAQEGAKIGSTLRIRKPDRSLVSDGAALQVQDENQQYTTLTVSSQKHIGLAFTSAELTMSIDEFSKLIIQPRVSQLAATIDADVAQGVAKLIGQSVGTPGTTPSTSQVLLQGQQKLNEMAAMMTDRYATVNPAANAALVEGMKGFFNPSSTISKQFKSGMMGEGVLGYDEINMSQSISNFTTGTRTNGTTGAAVAAEGATTITLAGLGAGGTIKAGEVFTVANVFAVNPQTRQSTGSLFQFVAKEDVTADGAGAGVVKVDAIYSASQALATVNALPGNGAAVTFLGGASTGYPQNLIYHKDAIAFATADLVMPKGVDMAARVNHNGISLRMIRDYDVNQDRLVTRLDVLYGYGVIRPELACRLWG
jgi:hypothetical protein